MPGRLVSPTLVGRAAELVTLEAALDAASEGRPIHQLLAGEAGVGKSRLVRAAVDAARARGFRVLEGGCADIGDGGVPYGPVVEAFRALARTLEPAGIDEVFGPSRADLARLVPSLGMAPEPATASDFVAPRLLDAILGVLVRLAVRAPVLVVVEDLHWADPATRESVASLLRQLQADRVLLLLTYREDELHRRHPLRPWLAELERGGRVARLTLERFDETRTATLIEAILGVAPSPALVEQVHRRADGNPFFVEELLGAGPGAGTGPIPPTLREVLLTRLVALPDGAQAVVRVAAVAGGRVDHDLLATVAAIDDDALIEALRAAVGSHVLVTGGRAEEWGSDAADDGDYAFRHALLQEAAYDDLLPGERQRLHRRFAEALAARGPGAGALAAGHWATLAWHWSAARDQRRTFDAAIRACDASARAFAYADAQRHGERALELWPTIDDATALAGMDRAGLLDRTAQAAWLAGDSGRAVTLRREAVTVLGDGDPVRLGIAEERLGRALWYHGETAAALMAHENAIVHIPEEPATPELARVLAGYGQILMLVDRWQEAIEILERAVGLARRTGARQAEGHARNSLGLCLAVTGRVAEAYASLEAALVIAHEIGSPDDIGRAYVNLSHAKRYAGDPAGALAVVRRGVIAAGEVGLDRTYVYFIRANGVQAAYELDAWDEAVALVNASVDGPQDGRVHRRYGLANTLPLLVGRGDERAADLLAELRTLLAGASVEAQFHAPFRVAEAEHALWSGDPEGAVAAVRQGLEELGPNGRRWYDLRLLRVGIRAAAEAAEVARARRDVHAAEAAVVTGSGWWRPLETIVEEARSAERGLALEEREAEHALAAAEHARLLGRSDPAAWRTARDRWAGRGNRYLAAYCGLRLAEGHLADGERARAAQVLPEAHADALGLGARPLLAAIEGLAARARIDLVAAQEEPPVVPLPRDPFGLTPRERDVLPLLVQGRTNRQIAQALFISENTAGVHVSNILGKLGAATRTEAAGIAARLGLGTE